MSSRFVVPIEKSRACQDFITILRERVWRVTDLHHYLQGGSLRGGHRTGWHFLLTTSLARQSKSVQNASRPNTYSTYLVRNIEEPCKKRFALLDRESGSKSDLVHSRKGARTLSAVSTSTHVLRVRELYTKCYRHVCLYFVAGIAVHLSIHARRRRRERRCLATLVMPRTAISFFLLPFVRTSRPWLWWFAFLSFPPR